MKKTQPKEKSTKKQESPSSTLTIPKLIQRELSTSERENFVLVIPDDVEKTIRTLCACSPNREWSGILFYTFEGDLKESVKITAKDIFLMDQGSTGHTTTDFSNPEIAQFMVRKGLLNCCMAAIHSHHSMGAFFSGEDRNTLNIEGNDMNNFVSLVVDNKGTYVAAITRKVKRGIVQTVHRDVTQSYPLFNTGETVSEEFSDVNTTASEEIVIESFPLKVIKTDGIKPDSIIERFGIVSSRPSTDSLLAKPKSIATEPSSFSFENWPYNKNSSKSNVWWEKEDPTLFKPEEWEVKKTGNLTTVSKKEDNKNNESSSRAINEARRTVAELLAGTPFTPSTLNQLLTKEMLKRIVEVYEKRFTLAEFDFWVDAFVRFELGQLESVLEDTEIPKAIEEIQGLLDSAYALVNSEYLKVLCQEIQFYY